MYNKPLCLHMTCINKHNLQQEMYFCTVILDACHRVGFTLILLEMKQMRWWKQYHFCPQRSPDSTFVSWKWPSPCAYMAAN